MQPSDYRTIGLRLILSLMTYVQSNGFDIFLFDGVHDYTGVFGPRFMVAMLHIYIYIAIINQGDYYHW